MSPLTFDDLRRFGARCIGLAAVLLCKQVAAQYPAPGTAPPAAPPSQPATAEFPAYGPNAPPPPPPPPPYATQQPTYSGPPPAYPQPGNGVNPPGPGVAPAPVNPPPAYPPPAPAAPPPGYAAQPYPAPPSSATPTNPTQPTYAGVPVEAAAPPSRRSPVPDFAVRVDPLNWLLEGRLGLELEVEAFEWLTIEAIPVFVMSREPLALPDGIRLYSNGWGPLSGASLSAGFWLEGNSFQGTVIRAGISNYAYRYEAIGKSGEEKEGAVIDEATLRQNRLSLVLGSGRRFGYFIMGGGFGIEYELNDQRRCVTQVGSQYEGRPEGCTREDFVLMRRKSEPDAANLRGPLFPVELVLRFSIGVVFDD